MPFKEPVAAAFGPSGKLAIVVRKPGEEGSAVHLWDCGKKAEDGEPLAFPGKVTDLAWSAGDLLAVAVGSEVRLLNPATRKEQRTIPAHAAAILGLAFTPDGRSLVTIGADKFVKQW